MTDDPAWDLVAGALGQLLYILVLTGVPRQIVMGDCVMVGMDHPFPRAPRGDQNPSQLCRPVGVGGRGDIRGVAGARR